MELRNGSPRENADDRSADFPGARAGTPALPGRGRDSGGQEACTAALERVILRDAADVAAWSERQKQALRRAAANGIVLVSQGG